MADRIALNLVRMGPIDPAGCYCSIEGGGSTYGDSADTGTGERYTFAGVVADSRDPRTARALIAETLKDSRLGESDKARLTAALESSDAGDGIDYLLFDETPMSAAARRLGYDAVRIVENDDLPTCASSVFVLNTAALRLQPRPRSEPPAAPLPQPAHKNKNVRR